MKNEKFFNTLFKKSEGLYCGNAYGTYISTNWRDAEFFSINPIDPIMDHAHFLKEEYKADVPRRADLNVTSFRNFLFEMDSVPLDLQLEIFQKSSLPFSSLTYSGGKSYHAILSVEQCVVGHQHTMESIQLYKHKWKRLAAFFDREAIRFGYSRPNSGSFVDHSCKNPSRLSRMPGVLRSNGELQRLMTLTTAISLEEFSEIIEKCPKIAEMEKREYNRPEKELETIAEFEAACPSDCLRKLKLVDWGESEGMYPLLFRYTVWALESTNVNPDTLVEFLERYTFKSLMRRGYPKHKLLNGVNDAIKYYGGK